MIEQRTEDPQKVFVQPVRVAGNLTGDVLPEEKCTRSDYCSLPISLMKRQNCGIILSHVQYQLNHNSLHNPESISVCPFIDL